MFIWTISGIALASCGGGGGGSSSGGRARPDPTPIKLADADGDPVSFYTGTINEDGTLLADNAGNDIPLPTIDASVDGEPQTRTYAYEFVTDTGTDATHLGFTISSAGAITFTGTAGTDLDYETAERHTLTVRVTYDSNGATAGGEMHTRDVRVVIDVGNVADQSEDIILMQDGEVVTSYTASVDEDASAGSSVVTISASVDNAAQGSAIIYGFVDGTFAGNISNVDDDRNFQINTSTGAITLIGSLDYETATSHTLTVRVTYDEDFDHTTEDVTRDVQLVIDVNDVEGIRLRQDGNVVDSYTASVDEDASAGASIVTLDASVDGAPVGHDIRYDVVHGSNFLSNTDAGSFFELTSSGEIRVLGLGTLDYETATSHEFTVRVSYDADGNAGTTNDIETRDVQVVINVNNVDDGDATYEIMQSTTTLAENTVLTARLLDGLDANDDPDGVESGSIRYQWFADGVEISGATSASYTIGSTVATIYDVRITYLDGYNAGLDANDPARTTTTAIASTSPIRFMQDGSQVLSYTASVDEDASAGSTVLTIDASVDDAQAGHAIDYQFVHPGGSTSNSDAGQLFQILSSGNIGVFGAGLDYETTPSYTLTVRVTYDADGSGLTRNDQITRDVQVVIDVNDVDDGDATYEIMQSTTTLAENTVLTARLLDGLDANDDPDGVESGSIRYQWFADGVEISGATSASYTIGSTVATIYDVRITYLDGYNAGLDANDPARTTTTAIASTSPIRFMQDGSQVLSYTASVDEDASAGSTVLTIDASVDDAQAGHAIDYQFVHSNGSTSNSDAGQLFQILSSGNIGVFGAGLDYETTPSYTLTVRVTYDADGSGLTRNDQITRDVQVVINVNDVDEQTSPAIIPDRQAFAHQDSYDPDELGLTPMPDADPSAG